MESMFEKIIKKEAEYYDLDLLKEQDPGMNPANGGGMDANMAPADPSLGTGEVDAQPEPTQGAELMFNELKADFKEIDPSIVKKLNNLQPDEVKDDEQGVAIIKEIERIFDEPKSMDERGY
jgi:hypothetical protein